MPLEVYLALAGFSLVSSITPGPNNIMLLSSGVNYGFRRTLPHMAGISVGFTFMLLCVGFGLGQVLEQFPYIFTGIKIAGATYLVYLAWRIAMAGPVEVGDGQGRPMTFLEAAAFQWVNPKAWVMAVTAMALYTDENNFMTTVFIVAIMFGIINWPSVSIWCGFGVALRDWLSDPKRLKIFNYTMAILLLASLWPMLR